MARYILDVDALLSKETKRKIRLMQNKINRFCEKPFEKTYFPWRGNLFQESHMIVTIHRKVCLLSLHDRIIANEYTLGNFDWIDEVRWLVSQEKMSSLLGDSIIDKIETIKKSRAFQADWEKLKSEFPDTYLDGLYYPGPILSNFEQWELNGWQQTLMLCQGKPREIVIGLRKVTRFLEKYRIDAVCNGFPVIDVPDIRVELRRDNASRLVKVAEVPFGTTSRVGRWLNPMAFSKLSNKWMIALDDAIQKRRAKWGEIKGTRETLFMRNKAILERYKELQSAGISKKKERIAIIMEELSCGKLGERWVIGERAILNVLHKFSKRLAN
jgi:hypothetical protein